MGKRVKKGPVDRSGVITDPKLIAILHRAAVHFGYPVDVVSNAFATYFAAVKSAMERPELPCIRMLNIGQFRLSTRGIAKQIGKLKDSMIVDDDPSRLRKDIERLEDILQREYIKRGKIQE